MMKMRKLILLIFISCVGRGFAQDSLNMQKIGGWTDSSPGTYYNDIWGYTDLSGKEYAILGSNHSTYFLDVSGDVPVLIEQFLGSDNDVHLKEDLRMNLTL